MALYEGIALIQEKQAVVLDLGTDYTKFGFTGEAAPRCIIPSQFWCPTERRYKRVHDFQTTEELYDNLVHMLHLLYFRHVLVNPKERKVVVVESLFTTTQFRETLAKVLFMHYEVSGVTWWDSARLSAATLGAPIALVVSVGAVDVEVVAVVHGTPVVHAMQSQPIGAHALHAELARILDEDNATPLNLTEDELEDIKVRTCFVPSRALAAELRAGAGAGAGAGAVRGAAYPRGRGAVRVSGRARATAAEIMFARDNELASLPDAVLQCIQMCPIDTRRALAENILVTGGGAALPGLGARLASELKHLVAEYPYKERLQTSKFKFHAPPCAGNVCAWAGGALVGAADGGARAHPRDAFLRRPRLRDWACLPDAAPPPAALLP